MPEGGNLRRFDALGKGRGLSFSGGVRTIGVAGDVSVGGTDGGVRGVVAAGEKPGEEASEAKGGNFEEVAFGA
jgi:hypothetical protein